LLKKKNTFTDFNAGVKHLIKTGYTNPGKLFAEGGSAGGLLMAQAMTFMKINPVLEEISHSLNLKILT
jgi:protease II